MGDESTEAGDETGQQPGGRADLLGEMKVLRRRARAARHAYWFPLVLFGVLICASAPFYIQPGGPPDPGQAGRSDRDRRCRCSADSLAFSSAGTSGTTG